MKNVGHVAAKNVLTFALAGIAYYAVGFGIAFGDGGNGLVGGSGFLPDTETLLAIGAEPFSWFGTVPAAGAYFFQVVFAGVSLAIVWGAMAERTKLWVYFAFGAVFVLIYSVVSHWIWHPDGWLFGLGMQDFAGSTVVHYQGALAALAGALLLGPRLGSTARTAGRTRSPATTWRSRRSASSSSGSAGSGSTPARRSGWRAASNSASSPTWR